MILTVSDRLYLKSILPALQGNYAHIKEARELLESLFTEQEESDLKIAVSADNKTATWLRNKQDGSVIPQERDFVISDGLTEKIGKFLSQMEKREELSMQIASLYEKMVKPNG